MTTKIQWKRLDGTVGQNPKPRHGHRAIAIKDLIVVFGGGNEGIVEDLNVYDCTKNRWFQPLVKGEIPTGCAAFGFASDGTRIIVFGGMIEYGKYSSDLWELNPLKWEWKKLKPRPPRTTSSPCARLGHTLTYAEGKYYLFGGLANDSKDPKQNFPRYLNDLYILEFKGNTCAWEQPTVRGTPPAERESHSCIAYRGQIENRPRLIIYGGMNGHRLGDIWSFYIDFPQWTQIQPTGLIPQPRSLHSAVLMDHRMLVFGGWIPLIPSDRQDQQQINEKEWKCTNTLASFNLETNAWELLGHESFDDQIPRARAGHCAVVVDTRMYLWSGRDGYRKAWNNQVCCKDLWCLETACPGEPEKVQLLKAGINNLEISWNPVLTADSYILQIQRVDTPVDPIPSTPSVSLPTVSTPIPLQSVFSSKSPQAVLASMIPSFEHASVQQTPSVSAMPDSTDTSVDPSFASNSSLNKTVNDPISISNVSTPPVSVSPLTSNSNTNTSIIFQTTTPTVRPSTNASTIQLVNNSVANAATIRPLIFHQKTNTNASPTQLLTVMPAGLRLQQLTPLVRPSTNQPTTIVRFMSPTTTTTGQQQIIQFNTTKQQTQPLVIKAITAQTSNRQQQPILLTTNAHQNTLVTQGQQQVFLVNQNLLSTNSGQQPKLTLQMTTADVKRSEPSGNNSNLPQLDGSIDEQDRNEMSDSLTSIQQSSTENVSNTSATINSTKSDVQQQTTVNGSNYDIETDGWHFVGKFNKTTADIRHYYVVLSKLNIENYDLNALEINQLVKKVDLESGIIYKLRIAAVNACGHGPWSEAVAFKTCLPGSPPAPSNIRISKTSDGGAHLTWDPPSNSSCLIAGYAVYLAVKNNSNDVNAARSAASQMAFVRVYGGIPAECSVNASQLQQAHLDVTSNGKSAIIFRIAARNERGYGPATQVRWLQDQQQPTTTTNSTGNNNLKRTNSTSSATKKQRLAVNNSGSNES